MTDQAKQGGEDSTGRTGFTGFLRDTWIWWLLPLVIVLGLAIVLLWLAEGDATSPFIYNEF
ncbi:MAG: DUF5989 family protein [Planctomycetota bacterium]|jgi:hypothetical protein